MLCVQGDCSVLKKKVAHCQLKRLQLFGSGTLLLPVLSGVKDNRSIMALDVAGDLITINITHASNYTIPHRGMYMYGLGPYMHIHWKQCPSHCHPYILKMFGCV